MSIIKGRVSDISDEFLQKLERAFPKEAAIFSPNSGQTLEDLAFAAGSAYVIDWINKHANKTTSTG